jgi:hypothetical protein
MVEALSSAESPSSAKWRMSALMRARGDAETAAALLSAPAELNVLDGIDSRMTAMLYDTLIDPTVWRATSDTQFAVGRMKHGLEASVSTIRKLTNIIEPPATRMVRVG